MSHAHANGNGAAPAPAGRGPCIFLGMPGYGHQTGGASRGFWRATRLPDDRVARAYREGSLLAANFNGLWCDALNLARDGRPPAYFAMQHADIEPQDWWLDVLIEELEARDLDILGVVAPIKDAKGVTSIALAHPTGDPWRIAGRLTMAEVRRLPETFTGDDLGRPLLLNTGLWVCRFDEAWARKVRFTINDRIVVDPDGKYRPQCEPEDWYFSRLLHELGLKVGCTRKVSLLHRGDHAFSNQTIWGEPFDSAWAERSPLDDAPGFALPAIDGWLAADEGKALADLARGKRVLEVGSYLGLSTVCMARTADQVVSVDTHDGRGTVGAPRDNTLRGFRENLERYGVGHKVCVIAGEFASTELRGSDPFGLIFIDGAHDRASVESDVAHALPLLAPGGLVCFHDYGEPNHPDVAAVVDELVASGGDLIRLVGCLAVVSIPAPVPLPLEV